MQKWKIKLWISLENSPAGSIRFPIPFKKITFADFAIGYMHLIIKNALKVHKREENDKDAFLVFNKKNRTIYVEYTTAKKDELDKLDKLEHMLMAKFENIFDSEKSFNEAVEKYTKFDIRRFGRKLFIKAKELKETAKLSLNLQIKYKIEEIKFSS